jgi:hypothetical protein
MRQAIFEALSTDSVLLTLLSGGIYDAQVVEEISRQNTPAAFDANGELRACALLRVRGPTAQSNPFRHGARVTLEVYFYRAGDAARERVYDLLHDTHLSPQGSSAGSWRIEHLDDVLGQEERALKTALDVSRYQALVRRR